MKRTSLLMVALLAALCMMAKTPKHSSAYYLTWAERFAQSQMAHDPKLWMADGMTKPKWDYTQALIAKAMLQTYQQTDKKEYFVYVLDFADFFIDGDGNILTYKMEDYNIDRINGGSFLYVLNDIMPEKRFEWAIERLYQQVKEQPRTKEGGFWHKKIYPWQMWLDGLYMAEPFYCRHSAETGDWAGFDDIQLQFEAIDRHTYDPVSGLNYHGWDESREQRWSDVDTGCSKHFWGRAMGWYLMAMVDVLDHMPKDHPGYASIQGMLRRSAKNLLQYQDPKTHLWYQVLDMPEAEGNYQETTCSAIFCYAFAKAANRGYLDKKYKDEAKRIFDSLLENKVVADGEWWDLTDCCSVAGLGGKPYRDGSYLYYVNEPRRSNDPKGVGPIIFAALELSK